MPAFAVDILRCPISHGPLNLHTETEAEAPSRRLVSADGRYAYPIENGIARLLAESAIHLNGEAAGTVTALRAEKEAVQAFYDSVGWQKDEEDVFVDTALFLHTNPSVERYMSKCRRRVKDYLKPDGQYLLDVASGPVHFPEYQEYSDSYQRRICVDLSTVALSEARGHLGDKGVYVIGDVTNLPFADGTLDGVASLHTLYHVPHDEQATAFREIHRVLKPGANGVVVYYWQTTPWRNRSLPMKVTLLPGRVLRRLVSAVRSRRSSPAEPSTDLYYHAHDYQWFRDQEWPFEADVRSWSSVNMDFLRKYVPRRGPVRWLPDALFWVEERFPRLLGRIGCYPMIVIRKR